MVSLHSDFFLFQETDYYFPHDDCDMKTSSELQTHFFSDYYLCSRILGHYRSVLGNSTHLDVLLAEARAHRGLRICGESFMRLKFLLEVIQPNLLRKKLLPAYKKRETSPFLKEPVVAIWDWEENATEYYSRVDVLANRVFLYIIDTLKRIVTGGEDNENTAWIEERLEAFAAMNAAMPNIRAESVSRVLWERFAPIELTGYAYCMFVLKLWETVLPVLSKGG
jgi:hypothetical protein